MATTKKRNLSLEHKPCPQIQYSNELQAFTIAELKEIAGTRLNFKHNENIVIFPNLSQKTKSSSSDKPSKIRKLHPLKITELKAIAGSGLRFNHNETMVSSTPYDRRTKRKYSENRSPSD